MSLAFVPLYVQYLGVESYGLIGLFAILQAWLSLLDMGMTPTLNREMARYTSGAHNPQSICNLLRSLEVVCFTVAALIAIGIWIASDWLATDWLKVNKLPTTVVAQAIAVMAFVVALRFVESIYRGSLLGLQKQVWYNVANAVFATVRHGGAVLILLFILPTIHAFFIWQAVISVLTIVVFALKVHGVLPKPPITAKFSRVAIQDIWKFAGGIIATTILALLLTQVDKILLSRLISLEAFGYYTLAATVASVISIISGPIAQAVYPRMVEFFTADNLDGLKSVYHQSAQLLTVLSATPAMLLVFFSKGAVFMWSGNLSLAQNTAPLVSALVLGGFLNGLMIIPYMLQLAHGWTSFAVKVNVVAVLVLIPAIFWVVPHYGALGAAWVWVTLNLGYILIGMYFMYQKLMPQEKWRWYFEDIILPILGVLIIVFLAHLFRSNNYSNRFEWLIFLSLVGLLSLLVSCCFASKLNHYILIIFNRFKRNN